MVCTLFKIQFTSWIGPFQVLPLQVRVVQGATVNKGVLRIPQSSRAGALPTDCLMSYAGHFFGGVLPVFRDAVNVFFSPS